MNIICFTKKNIIDYYFRYNSQPIKNLTSQKNQSDTFRIKFSNLTREFFFI